MIKYNVMSPDGISIERDKTYETIDEAGEALEKWVHRYDAQGHYSSNHGRIPVEQLALHCKLITIEMTNKETVDEAVQEKLEELFDELNIEFKLDSGDISPGQMIQLEAIQNQLSALYLEWVEQNVPKKLKPLFDSMKGD